jgi:UTP--glucose-1-phosphate uridylyltransferase
MSRIRKVVIPAAGLGTRLLPATKVIPKELLPISGKPLIQFAVEEAVASGLETVILVLSVGKSLVAEHFRQSMPLEKVLSQRGKTEELELIHRLSELADVRTVLQRNPLGLADAIGCARSLIGDEPFAVILPDAVIDSTYPCLRQLMSCYDRHPGCILATREVDASEVGRFGVLELVPQPDSRFADRLFRVNSLIERPVPGSVSSRYGIFGRYILESAIFECIDRTVAGFSGELQLTDSLLLFCQQSPVYALCFEGTHYDAGDQFGLIRANIDFCLKDPDLGGKLRNYLANLNSKLLLSVS